MAGYDYGEAIKLLVAGEQGLVIELGDTIAPEINTRVQLLAQLLSGQAEGILEIIPTYRSVLVYFDPLTLDRTRLTARIKTLLSQLQDKTDSRANPQVVSIPVCYGGEFGPDLEFVAAYNGLSVDEVIQIHSATPYQVYMLGFTPGFPYLGGMSAKIATPRLEKPRLVIPAGSVGIAGAQTGFYPIESPGGWQLIGRTPIKAFNPESSRPFAFAAGDYLQFVPVSAAEYEAIQKELDSAGSRLPVTGGEC